MTIKESDLRGIKEPREPVRAERAKRGRIVGKGPLYIPQEIRDQNKGYFLYWAVSSSDKEYTLLELRRNGYDFVPAEQLTVLSENFGTGLEHTYSDGNYICTGTGNGTKSYLMRIKQEIKDEIDAEHLAARLKNQSRITDDPMALPGVFKK